MKVYFDRWGGDEPLEGQVRTIGPFGFNKTSTLGVEEQRVNVIADFVSRKEDRQRLGDGYRVDARFVVWEDEDVLRVAYCLPSGVSHRYPRASSSPSALR